MSTRDENIRYRNSWLYFVTIFLFTTIGAAQHLVFSPVEGREQLNEEKIRNIIQLKDGRLGVFTIGMLNLYDGSGFKTIHINDENTIPLNNYTGFHHSYLENNRLWFKNMGKLAIVNLESECTITNPEQILQELGFNNLPIDIYLDQDESIWVLTDTYKLLRKFKGENSIEVFLKDVRLKENPDDMLFDVVRLKNKTYLIYKSGFIREFDSDSGKELFHTYLTNEKTNFDNWVHVTVVNDKLYIVRGGYYIGQLLSFNTQTHEIDILIEANEYWLNCFAANKGGDFYMSCRKGLWYFKSGEKKGHLIETMSLKDGEKLHTEISTIYFDNQDGFWAGTLNKGLFYYHPNRFRFENYKKDFFENNEDGEIQINCFEELNNKQILIGSNTTLYKVQYPINEDTKPVELLTGIECNSMCKDDKGTIWVGTSKGLFKVTDEYKVINAIPDPVNYIYKGKDHSLYICTVSNGILKMDLEQSTPNLASVSRDVLNAKQILEYEEKLIGLSENGPFIFENETADPKYPLEKGENRLPMFQYINHKYTCLLKDSDNDLWLGTYDGLTLWSTKEKKLYTIHTDQGLVNNSIKAIIEDKDHSYWITTSMGISHLYKKIRKEGYEFDIQNYNTFNGLIDHAFTERSIFLTSNGVLFVGGIEGMNILPSDKKNSNLNLSPIPLSLKILGKYKEMGINELGITYKKDINLKYNQNFFTISFSGLNYINPLQTYYRYKLEGIDEDWREQKTTLGNGEANYTGIPPGDYLFKIQASSDGLNWSGTTKTLNIHITPPFWRTTWAYILYVLFIVVFITTSVFQVNKRIAIRRRKEQERAIELAKSEFITNISHELRTPLTLVITPLRALAFKMNDHALKKELLQINNNAQLTLDVVNQLLEFKKMDLGKESLHLNFYENLKFIEELSQQYINFASEKGVELLINISKEELCIYIDRQKVSRIVANLLSNSIKYTPSEGRVIISAYINKNKDTLIIEVEDNGIGIPEEEKEKIFDRFYQAKNQKGSLPGSGLGLFMVREYAQLHGGFVSVESSWGKGSTFRVELSVQNESPKVYTLTRQNNAKATILIADDNAGFRSYLKTELAIYYNIIVCENGREALEKTLLHSPNLVVSDMMMPELTGDEFCRALRNDVSISHTPIILLTGRTSDEARLQGYESGADAYLVKPFDIQILLIQIDKLLEVSFLRKKTFIETTIVETEHVTTNLLDKTILDSALELVRNNLKNPDYTVEKFSADMCMDRTGLYRKLMALTGLSPTAFIRNVRLKKAAELLSESKLPITEIAEETGFNSTSYFAKCFHEIYGQTPSQYRTEKVG